MYGTQSEGGEEEDVGEVEGEEGEGGGGAVGLHPGRLVRRVLGGPGVHPTLPILEIKKKNIIFFSHLNSQQLKWIGVRV